MVVSPGLSFDSAGQVTCAGVVGAEPPAPALAVCVDPLEPAVLAAGAPAVLELPAAAIVDALGMPEGVPGAAAVDPAAAPLGFIALVVVAFEPAVAVMFDDAGALVPLAPDAVVAGAVMLLDPFDAAGATCPSPGIAALPHAVAPTATSTVAAHLNLSPSLCNMLFLSITTRSDSCTMAHLRAAEKWTGALSVDDIENSLSAIVGVANYFVGTAIHLGRISHVSRLVRRDICKTDTSHGPRSTALGTAEMPASGCLQGTGQPCPPKRMGRACR